MNNIEETLWNYIDGNCSPDEQKAISALIAHNETYRLKYHELLNLNHEFSAMQLDEPPMAFTYNVIAAIRNEQALQPLKATINKRVIRFITAFFALTILVLLIVTLANVNWQAAAASGFKLPNFTNYINRPVFEGFLFFDIVLALFLFDTYLRKSKFLKQG